MDAIILTCEKCRRHIHGDTGSLYIRLGDIVAVRQAHRDWREQRPAAETALSIVEVVATPDEIRWNAAHDACRTDRDEDCYEIDAPLIGTWRHVTHWTAHLMSKNWFGLSDWDDLLRELAGDTPAKRIAVMVREEAA